MSILLCGAAIFGLAVFVHELGHFVAAKLLGIRVITFSIGFGPRLWAKRIGQTVYCIGMIPFGGYVRPFAAISDESARSTNQPQRSRSFLTPFGHHERELIGSLDESDPGNLLTKPAFSRFVFLISGVVFNLVSVFCLAFVFFAAKSTMVPTARPQIGTLADGGPAAAAALKANDLIIAVDNVAIDNWRALATSLQQSGGKAILLTVQRGEDGGRENLTVQVLPAKAYNQERKATGYYTLGIGAKLVRERVPLSSAFMYAADFLQTTLLAVLEQLSWNSDDQSRKSADSEPGPGIGVVSNFLDVGYQASQSTAHFISFFAALSAVLVLFNLLPLPALDGGQILLLILQRIFRLPISLALEQRLMYSGILLVGGVFLFSLGADLVRSAKLLFG